MNASIRFLGADRQVTGSKHLVTIGERKVLLDCGMVQGPRRLADRLNHELPFEPGSIDAVVLSHAHIDHSGSLPRLVRLGYEGPIYCTPATADLLAIMLADSAHLQSSDARHLRKRGRAFDPAYEMVDVDRTLRLIQTIDYRTPQEILPGVQVTYLEAGHILGSAQVVLDLQEGGESLRLGFTGDLGRKGTPILRNPDPLPPCEVLITESTYGDRLHPTHVAVEEQLREFLVKRQSQPGRILIPAFSVGRTQNLLWYLGRLLRAGKIAPIDIYVDSPLSNKTTAIVSRHKDLYDPETKAMLDGGHNPFYFEGVHTVTEVEESKALNKLRGGIIISASGMCEGGRILHHLEQTVDRPEDCILMVGYQAEGTLGRKLLEGFETVKIFGEAHLVRCKIEHMDGLSAHADYQELLDHLTPQVGNAKKVFVVHGEENAAMKFVGRLEAAGFQNVEAPLFKESYPLRD
ncbi:MAG: MBL fold metallo-hydrolase [Planctomycetes bacterium]|nr:MBL fold metallo-hydrolase [Planctomycetota bacterium]MCB9909008.1 MBL fold metallo-hydrolase [Planctomycetota bacterium]MCB9911747.1 MBL fold metallo-hydrolase [Planctomycetota bacterium]